MSSQKLIIREKILLISAKLIVNLTPCFIDQLTKRRQFGVSKEDVKAMKAARKAAKKEAKEAGA